MNLYDVSIQTLRRRLGNFILEKIFELEEDEDTELSDFIHSAWEKEQPELLIDLQSRKSLRKGDETEELNKKKTNESQASSNKMKQESAGNSMRLESPSQSLKKIEKDSASNSVRKSYNESAASSLRKNETGNLQLQSEPSEKVSRNESLKQSPESSFRSKKQKSPEASFVEESAKESDLITPKDQESSASKIRKIVKEDPQNLSKKSTEFVNEESQISKGKPPRKAEPQRASVESSIQSKENSKITDIMAAKRIAKSLSPSKKNLISKHTKTPSLLMIYQDSKLPTDESKQEIREEENSKQELMKQNEIYPPYSEIVFKETWLTKILKPMTKEIEDIFFSYDHKEEGLVEAKMLKLVFKEVMGIAKIDILDNGLEDFENLVNKEYITDSTPQSVSMVAFGVNNILPNKVSYNKFMKLVQK